jgi:hypothetical protein
MEQWIGGLKRDGENYCTRDGLQDLLCPDGKDASDGAPLVLLEEKKVPFVIPDADGTFQYTYSNVTIFGRADFKC